MEELVFADRPSRLEPISENVSAINHPLYLKLERFDLDKAGGEPTFAARLAKKNNWNIGFATRVFREYKRFIFLSCIDGQVAVPSRRVDSAWHLHLTYTKSYWLDLCRDILNRPLHHVPSAGSEDEREYIRYWYDKTLAAYRRVFDETPPDDIWPPAATYFAENDHPSMALRMKLFRLQRWGAWQAIKGALGVGCIAFGIWSTKAQSIGDLSMVVAGVGFLLVVAAIYNVIYDDPWPSGDDSSGSSGLSCMSG